MLEIAYLKPGQQMPEFGDNEHWLTIDASNDGRFFGTGYLLLHMRSLAMEAECPQWVEVDVQ